jgi:hypothetical protein
MTELIGTKSATLLQQTFSALQEDAEFTAILGKRDLSLLFVQYDPESVVFVSAEGVSFTVDDRVPTLRFELSGDTLHQLLTGRLSLPRAAAARLLNVKGPVARLRELGEVLPRVGAKYGELAARQAA